jgi:predicted amidohydrolase
MRVAGVQFDIAWEEPEESLDRVAPLVRRAVEAGARLVALPEMFATGFSMNAPKLAAFADEIRTGVVRLASQLDVWILAGLAEAEGNHRYNACTLVAPDGTSCLHYRKIHPFTLAREDRHYDAGTAVETAEVEGVRITPLICYDLRFGELFRATADRTDLFIVIANWPDRRSVAWRVLLRARAIDCQAWLLGVNRMGTDGNGVAHRGDSSFVDPLGEVLSSVSWEEGVVVGDVDVAAVRTLRDKLPFLADRRPDVYRDLESSETDEKRS